MRRKGGRGGENWRNKLKRKGGRTPEYHSGSRQHYGTGDSKQKLEKLGRTNLICDEILRPSQFNHVQKTLNL